MDNITHTLVGLALAEAGLKKRTALGTATLAIGANFPDIDVVAVPFGANFGARRGVTHGLLALVVLPFVLALLMRFYDQRVRRHRDPTLPPADYRQLVILSAISILTHPTLDFMNEYGMRWLMPFVDKWFYGDSLFIVDIWILIGLSTAVWLSRRRGSTRPARIALVGLATYVVVMIGITALGRSRVTQMYPDRRIMVSPGSSVVSENAAAAIVLPWIRSVLVEDGTRYRFGSYSLLGDVQMSRATIAKGDADPAVALAKARPEVRGFLGWARFPFYRAVRDSSGTVVRMADARYVDESARGWAAVEIRVPDSRKPSPPSILRGSKD